VAFIRGANWNNGANAGVWTLNLNNAPSNTNWNIGFRCSRSFYSSMELARVSFAKAKPSVPLKLHKFTLPVASLGKAINTKNLNLY